MNLDREVVDMIATGVAVNAVAVLVVAVMSYVLAHLILSGLAALDAWMDPLRKPDGGHLGDAASPGSGQRGG
jgi:hypothetical protein